MRADGVFRLILNASLFTGMPCSLGQDPKFVKLSVIEDGAFIHHAIKVRLCGFQRLPISLLNVI
jgi:Ran-binding protein 3